MSQLGNLFQIVGITILIVAATNFCLIGRKKTKAYIEAFNAILGLIALIIFSVGLIINISHSF